MLGAVELRRRRELVARACHELRGPLTAVRLSLATMERRREVPPERLATLEHELRRAGLALDDFAAARRGRRIVDREEPVEVAELLEEQYHSWEAVAGAFDSVVLLGELLPGAVVVADRLRLAQAISNLIANALEHAPGCIELNARVVGPRRVRIEVIDEGAGPAARARRAHPARARRPRAPRTRAGDRRDDRRAPPRPARRGAGAAGLADRHRAAARAARRAAVSRRRRALLLGGLALVLGGLAAFNVAGREAALQRRVGGLVDVVVARAPDRRRRPRARAGAGAAQRARALRADGDERARRRRSSAGAPAVDIPARADLNAGMIVRDGAGAGRAGRRRGERVAEVVALGSADARHRRAAASTCS